MTRYPCSGCGLWHCDGRCYQGERYLDDPVEADPREAAAQVKRAEAFWERRQTEQFTECLPDPLLRRSAA